jgi:hypothetical protein
MNLFPFYKVKNIGNNNMEMPKAYFDGNTVTFLLLMTSQSLLFLFYFINIPLSVKLDNIYINNK